MKSNFYYSICFFILLSAFSRPVSAQLSTARCKWVKSENISFKLDTLSIQPGSVKVTSPSDQNISVDYDINTNLVFISGENFPDSIQICYRVFPFNLSKPYFKRDISEYDSNQIYSENTVYGAIPETREEIFSTPGINKSGVITRGVTVGNTQNVFVNSSLNLQLEGKLNEEVSMVAAISDQNVPYQPEGNTQTINEFDKVFIKFYTDKGSLTVGDLVLQNKPSGFLRYHRNVQGAQLEANLKKNDKIFSTTTVGAAVSKGKFASVNIEPLEGVQGPYRIKISDNERFTIILANSEKVFLDGRLLERGYNYDYVIDYNQSEITFTNSVLITKYSRIRVDVEYAERNYARTILTASHIQNVGKTTFSVNYFTQKDNPRNPLLLDLSEQDKILLGSVGDSLSLALAPTIDSVDFTSDKVLYKRVDTLVNSVRYTAYVYSTNPDLAFYEITFAEVGPGQGDYILSSSTTNGRVFVWVEPVNGIPQGNYAPVRLLPAPVKNEMAAFGAAYNFSKDDRIYFETALSVKDNNLYSSIHDSDNQGWGSKIGYENTGKPISFLKDYKWLGAIDYEYNSKEFTPIDRFRSIEFDRDWSVALDEQLFQEENIFNVGGGIVKNTDERAEYKFTRRVRGSSVNGFQHRAAFYEKAGNFYLKSDYFYLQNHRLKFNSYWQRLSADISFKSKFIVPGYVYQFDKNEERTKQDDYITASLMNFDEHKFYLQSPDSSQAKFLLDYSYRTNNFPHEGEMKKLDRVHMASGMFGKNYGENNINLTLTYRSLENLPDSLRGKREETVMARVDHNQYLFKKSVRSELTYSTFTGRELQREFVYLPVATGLGTHTWRDENEDGIKDLNEFYEAINPDEKNFVKFFVPTDKYIQAYTSNFNYRLNIVTPASWENTSGIPKMLSRFSVISSWVVEKKTTSENLESRLLPFVTDVFNPYIISFRESVRGTLFYNKSSSSFGVDLNYFSSKFKQPLTNGFELRTKEEYFLNSRLNINSTVNTRLGVIFNQTEASSNYLTARNFLIHGYKTTPEIAFQPRNNFRISTAYAYTFKNNLSNKEKNEIAVFNELSFDLKWTKLSNRTLQITAKYTNINFDGVVNTASGYEMLEALRPGGNYGWSLNWLQKLSNGLQLSINYEGRKSESQRVIHIGRMQVAALF